MDEKKCGTKKYAEQKKMNMKKITKHKTWPKKIRKVKKK